MIIKIDFVLNDNVDIVGQTIFHLVINGICNSLVISDLLRIYSDDVIANAIRKLVNGQIISADINKHELQPSSPVVALIEKCLDQVYDIDIPPALQEYHDESKMILGEMNDNEDYKKQHQQIKQEIIRELLPDIDMRFLLNYIDFGIQIVE